METKTKKIVAVIIIFIATAIVIIMTLKTKSIISQDKKPNLVTESEQSLLNDQLKESEGKSIEGEKSKEIKTFSLEAKILKAEGSAMIVEIGNTKKAFPLKGDVAIYTLVDGKTETRTVSELKVDTNVRIEVAQENTSVVAIEILK